MEQGRFDRLAVLAARLGETGSRRRALGLLLGAIAGGAAAEASAKTGNGKKGRNGNCRGYGQYCDNHRKCCQGRCRYNRCFPGGGSGGGGGNDGWNCRPYGSYCNNNGQCCNGRCKYNVCVNGDWDGSGCGPSGYDCPIGTSCCTINGYRVCCVDDGGNDGWRKCNGNGDGDDGFARERP